MNYPSIPIEGGILSPDIFDRLEDAVGQQPVDFGLDNYLRPLLETAWLEQTIPDKPTSRLQRYRTTAAGLTRLENAEEQPASP